MTAEPQPEAGAPLSGPLDQRAPPAPRPALVAATVFGVVVFGGLIALAVADPSARALLITAAGILAMIILGVTFGGRATPDVRAVPPRRPTPTPPPAEPGGDVGRP